MILSKRDIYILYILLLVVYIIGMFIPIMENDSAQHAAMAMRMYLENDFSHIYKGTNDYLDKPHMHFWLAALSFNFFGISPWVHRLPALLFTLMGAMYSHKLAKCFYGRKIAHMASLVFLSSQAIVFSNHDVRTDAVLTGSTIFALYHFVKYLDKQAVKHKFKLIKNVELLTSLGVFLILLVISTSKFKLAYHLNSLIPLMSILVVGYL